MTDQIVRIESADSSVSVGDTIALNVIYETDDSTLSGLGLQLHFDSTELQFESVQNVLATNLFPGGGTPVPDNTDFDGDAETDTFIPEAWISLDNDWPGETPVTLYTIGFTVLEGFDGTTINFSESEDNPDATFVPESFALTLDGGSGNNAPIAENDTADTDEDTAITIAVAEGILANDSDPDGDPRNITQVNGTVFSDGDSITLDSGAILTLNADGSYAYNPNGQFEDLNDGNSATDTFTYTISDGELNDTATVTINITGVTDNPDAPDAVNDTATVVQGSILTIPAAEGILTNDSDPDGIETVDITEVNGSTEFAFDQPITLASGTILTLDAEGGYVYDPNGKTGSDSFTYTISDGTNEDTATVNITITGEPGSFTLDIDANGSADAATDGLLIIRYLFGFQGDVLTEGAISPNATITDAGQIIDLLDENRTTLDIDGNGSADAATDGLLIIRRLFGFQDSVLIEGAVAPNATITDAGQIADIIDSLTP
jgi:VCBS repeat-containing protein